MKKGLVLFLAIWIMSLFPGRLEAEEKIPIKPGTIGTTGGQAKPGTTGGQAKPAAIEGNMPSQPQTIENIKASAVPTVAPSVKKTEEEPVPIKEITKKWEGDTEILITFKGKIKELREIEKTEKKEIVIIVEKEKTVVIAVGPKTEIFLEDETRSDIRKLKNTDFIEAFCNVVPQKGRFIARIIKIIKPKPEPRNESGKSLN